MEPSGSTPMIWRKQFPLWLPCHPAFWEHSYLLVSAGRVTAVGVTLAAHTWLQLTADWVCCSPLPGSVPLPADRMLCCFWPLGKPGSAGCGHQVSFLTRRQDFQAKPVLIRMPGITTVNMFCANCRHISFTLFPLPLPEYTGKYS